MPHFRQVRQTRSRSRHLWQWTLVALAAVWFTLSAVAYYTGLHEAGEVNRYPEDTAAELARALPIFQTKAPSLTRPATTGGGSAGLPNTPAQPQRPRSLIG